MGTGAGPLGTNTNCSVSDGGTLVCGPSPLPGPLCAEKHPFNRSEVDHWGAELRDLEALVNGDRRELLFGFGVTSVAELRLLSDPPWPAEEVENAAEDLDTETTAREIARRYFQRIRDGLDRDSCTYEEARDDFIDAVTLIELARDRVDAALAFGRSKAFVGLTALLAFVTNYDVMRAKAIAEECEDLRERLEQAKRNVVQAEFQMRLNLCLFAASKILEFVFPPIIAVEATYRTVALAAGVIASDHLLGPSSDTFADVDAAGGALLEHFFHTLEHHHIREHLAAGLKQAASFGAAAGTFYFDKKEIDEAKHIAHEFEELLESAEKEVKWLEHWTSRMLPQIKKLVAASHLFMSARSPLLSAWHTADQAYRDFKNHM